MNLKLLLTTIIAVIFLSLQANGQKIVTIAGGSVAAYAGDGGKAANASLHWPMGIALDRKSNIYIADADNNVIRKIDANTGFITTIAGTGLDAGSGFGFYSGDGAAATTATLFAPSGIAIDTSGNIFIADASNNCIRKIDGAGNITTVVGTGVAGFGGDGAAATAAKLSLPSRVAVDTFGNMYITDTRNHRVRKVDVTKKITTIAGTGVPDYTGDGAAANLATLNYPTDVIVDTFKSIYIADKLNNCVRKIDSFGIITTIAGSLVPAYSGDGGPATVARLYDPEALALDDSFNLFISDWGNSVVRKVDKAGIITTYAGSDSSGFMGDGGPATAARLLQPMGLAVNKKGSLYICDMGNNRIRFVGSAVEAVNPVTVYPVTVRVYPNPSPGAFTLRVASVYNEQMQATITNAAGQQVFVTTGYTNTPKEMIPDAPPGVYFLSISTAHELWKGQIVVR
jgi:sugar lactone lactonase YvrE